MYKINPCVADFTLDQQNICNLCKKKVVNLSDYSESEVVAIANSSPVGICGSGPISRMNTTYYLHPFRRFALALIVVFGSSLFILDAQAQDTIVKLQNEGLNPKEDTLKNETIISGTVIDKETGETLPFVNIWYEIESVKHGAYTDLNGQFKFILNLNNNNKSNLIVLNFSFVGYDSFKLQNIKVKPEQTTEIGNIELSEWSNLVGIVIGSVYVKPFDFDPNAHRSTTIKRKDIERLPRSD